MFARSIQVDGGSEFMKDFDAACQAKGIPLYVLPPKRLQYNGGVERINRTMRDDLYAVLLIVSVQEETRAKVG